MCIEGGRRYTPPSLSWVGAEAGAWLRGSFGAHQAPPPPAPPYFAPAHHPLSPPPSAPVPFSQATIPMTHFAPPDREAALVHTTRPLYLPHEEFERYLGCPCPIGQLQLAFLPADAQVQEVQVGAGIILVSTRWVS